MRRQAIKNGWPVLCVAAVVLCAIGPALAADDKAKNSAPPTSAGR